MSSSSSSFFSLCPYPYTLVGRDEDSYAQPSQALSAQRKRLLIGGIVMGALLLVIVGGVAVLGASINSKSNGKTPSPSTALRDAMKITNLMNHLKALEAIAIRNNNTRSGKGFNESAEYVRAKLREGGYESVREEYFYLPIRELKEEPHLSIHHPTKGEIPFSYDTEFLPFKSSPTANIPSSPITLVPNLGCNTTDYSSFPNRSVALVVRGECTFVEKVINAQRGGAVGVIVMNDGNVKGGLERFVTMSPHIDDAGAVIPAFFGSYSLGIRIISLLDAQPTTAGGTITVSMYAEYEDKGMEPLHNTIAETRGGNPFSVLFIGAHLDSVEAGPGINDNGSGSGMVLELALQWAKLGRDPINKIRFGWWAAEERGLIGSSHHVASLSYTERNEIALYLNFDMMASPNYQRLILNGTVPDAPAGSDVIAKLFCEYFDENSLPWDFSPFDGRSDYGPFLEANIPAGGFDAGADKIKSDQGRKKYGGMPNVQLDTCYHKDCDTVDNIDEGVYMDFARAAASVVGRLAMMPNLPSFIGRHYPPPPSPNPNPNRTTPRITPKQF